MLFEKKIHDYSICSQLNNNGDSIFHRVVEAGCLLVETRDRENLSLILSLLLDNDHGRSVINGINKQGYSALHLAARVGDVDSAAQMLKNGAEVDVSRDTQHMTPLMVAAGNGHMQIVELLIAYGARVDGHRKQEESGGGWFSRKVPQYELPTPLELAAIGGYAEVVVLLHRNNAILKKPSSSNETTLLHKIAQKVSSDQLINEAGYHAVVGFLLEEGFYVDCRDEKGHTALYYAIGNGRKSVEEALKAHGASE